MRRVASAALLLAAVSPACAGGSERPPEVAHTDSVVEAPPEVEEVAPEPVYSLTPDQVKPGLKKCNRIIAGCHALVYAGDADAAGVVVLDFTIQPDGSVAEVQVDAGSLNQDFAKCISTGAQKLKFPEATAPTPVSKRTTLR